MALLGGLFGDSAGKADMEESLRLQKEAADLLKGLYVPTVDEQRVTLTDPELAGLLGAEQLGDTAMAGVTTDPRLRNAQMKALEELSGLSRTGLGVEDQAAFNNLRKQAGAEAQAAQAATLQNAAAQGTLDSGNTLMAQLMAGQNQANRLQDAGQDQAAQASAARRQALSAYANQANTMGTQDFAQKATIGTAKDAISKFNAQNRQDVNATNLQNKQNIANTSAANKNQSALYNSGLIQQQFQNKLGQAGGAATQIGNLAGQYASQGQAAAQGQADQNAVILSGAAKAGAAYAGSGSGAAAGGQTAKSGYGGGTAANSYDDYYMNKVK